MVVCPSLLETVDIYVPVRNLRDIPLFTVGSSHNSCLSARSASAANTIFKVKNVKLYPLYVMEA
jgi:hypothetical protein